MLPNCFKFAKLFPVLEGSSSAVSKLIFASITVSIFLAAFLKVYKICALLHRRKFTNPSKIKSVEKISDCAEISADEKEKHDLPNVAKLISAKF